MKKIAFFDFDGTITTKDTLLEFIKFSKGSAAFYFGFLLYSPYMVAFKLKIISNQLAKERILRHFFGGQSLEAFQTSCDKFAASALPRLIRPKALSEIQALKDAGTRVVIVSASPQNWIRQWTDSLEISLIATELEVNNGRLTGRIAGKNCHGLEKTRRIREVFNLEEFGEIHAYGDSSADIPMLSLAQYPNMKPFRS